MSMHGAEGVLKRILDVCVASVGLTASFPLLLCVAAAVRGNMGSPVLYRQVRIGLGAKPFRLWKFRTMSNERSVDGALLPDAERLTRLGRFLRETSLDELPQLLNVVAGEMSIVGPRPLLARYVPRYSPRQRLRHAVRPGITGWAQINGRNSLGWDAKLELDAWYAENASLALDIRIILRTVLLVLRRESVLSGAGAEMDEFWGAAGRPADGPRAYPVEENESIPSGPA
jgi:lipopolysaccharide/colanic/teichoic acid biosynthesis glycosyltransferase